MCPSPSAGGTLLAYVRVDDGRPGRLHDLATATDDVAVRVVDEHDGGGLLEFGLDGGSMLVGMVERGTVVTAARAESGTCRVVAEASPDAEVRSLVERVRQEVPDATLVAKRELDRPVENVDAYPGGVLSDLTDRQRQALGAAYHAGYFDWPRESTAQEVAQSMNVSEPTYYHHLRAAQNKLLAAYVDPPVDR
ncbi:bacterio-opsin activator domain-containing protein [Haloarchaeobius sp. HRN-SO-5]|uniref:bacterio-opsin activator domain-containing protein n=1 Tax=Haloarchaeobius sp. HRN-SO-5 TaxID=3446118 RepID=UPI003EBEB41A